MNVKDQVIAARYNGRTYSQIRDEFGVPESTARGWVKNASSYDGIGFTNLNNGPTVVIQGFSNDNLSRDKKKKFDKSESEVLDFIAQLAPIKVSPKYETPFKNTDLSDYAVVGSDFHFGCHDQKAIDIFLETIYQLKPKTIVLNGDTMDFLAISKYPKDIKHTWSLQKEREEYHAFLDELIGVSNGAEIFETYSNHSGGSVQGRWRRYLSDRIGELACLPDIADILSYENVFLGDYKDKVKHVDSVQLNDLVVTHGDTVRKMGGASARGEIDKWHSSIMHGHTHRVGSTCQRVPGIGNRKEKQYYGFEGGCLCSLDAVYGNHLNWQQGFNIVSLDTDGHTFGVEQVLVNQGRANIATLGCSLKA